MNGVCLYVKDEARGIAEWIAYYLELGFDHLFIYDNNSTDGTPDRVRAIAASQPVTLVPWNFESRHAQYMAYDHCLHWARGRFEWVACFDSDEFLVLNGVTLRQFLAGRDEAGAIAVHWAFFGSAGHEAAPKELTIEAFTKRAPDDFSANRHIKSIVRPHVAGPALNPHGFADVAYQLADRSTPHWTKMGITETPADHSVAQLNHYFVRSRTQWAAKIARGYRDIERSLSEFEEYDRNDVEDRGAADAALAVGRRMAQFELPGCRPPSPELVRALDPFYYALRYPDVAQAGVDPVAHFWTYGLGEGRDPNPYFEGARYAAAHLVDTATVPAFAHFLTRRA